VSDGAGAGLPPVLLPDGRAVPEHALAERADTSGGPGGQHANRTASRIELRLFVAAAGLREPERQRIFERLGSRITQAGELVVSVGDSRSQLQNRHAARKRMEGLLAEGLEVAAPRRRTRVPRGVINRIRENKKQQSAKKRARTWRPEDDL